MKNCQNMPEEAKGVWFSYTPTVTGTSVVDTCGSDFDTKIQIFGGGCGALTSIGCNDDSPVCGGNLPGQSSFSFPGTAGSNYLICAGANAGAAGNLRIRAYSVCSSDPPANDTCATAFTLTDNSDYSGQNTSCAMDDTNLSCTSAATIYRGVWYKFVASATGTMIVDTCGSDFDTKMIVFSGGCEAFTLLGCNDDSSCGGSSNLQSSYRFSCTNGATYYICAGGYGGAAGNLRIRASPGCGSEPPANDTCARAFYLPDGQTYTAVNTACATDDINQPCIMEGTIYRGVWFSYTPTVSGMATVDTCTSDFDTKIIVFGGTCGALTALGCNDNSTVCDRQSSFSFPCAAGTTYYICAGGYGGHSGSLKLRAYSVCSGVPANDLCSEAVDLGENTYYEMNTGCATDEAGLPCLGTNYSGAWFTYTPAVSGWAEVDTCPSDFDTKLEVFSGGCGDLTSLGCNDDSPCGSPWILQSSFGFSCIAGRTYHICAGGYGGAFGNLEIRARTTAPPNDTCAGAFGLSDNVYYTEHTGTATDDQGFTCDTIPYAKGVWFTYTALQTGTLSVDCCPSDFDTKLEVLDGACGALRSIQCSDDACGFDQLRSQLSITATCGTTYYICAGGFYDNDIRASGNLQIRAVLTNPRPNPPASLAIGRAGTNVVISWPASSPCFTLYSATNLSALPADWVVVSPPPVMVSGQYAVTNAVLGSTRFYRLQ